MTQNPNRDDAAGRALPSIDALLASLDAQLGAPDGDGVEPDVEALRALRSRVVPTEPEPASEALRVRRVTESVLRRSTREDFSRRGDLGLVLDFGMERLRESALLRVAVALLVVQVTLVPLVARMIVQREKAPVLHIRLEQHAETLEEALPAAAGPGGLLEDDRDLTVDSDPIEPNLDLFELDSDRGVDARPLDPDASLAQALRGWGQAGARLASSAMRLMGLPMAPALDRLGDLFRDR